MILIITNASDYSSYHVLSWINHICATHCIVLNEYNYISEVYFSIIQNKNETYFSSSHSEVIDFSKIQSIWYRRGPIKVSNTKTYAMPELKRILSDENNSINEYLLHIAYSNNVFVLGTFYPLYNSINKLCVLDVAKKCGLITPNSYIINKIKYTTKFIKHTAYITKNITNTKLCTDGKTNYKTLTFEIKLNGLPEKFFPSLIQHKIDKKYELRIFYLCGTFYTSAIFSQSLKQTSVDYRNYNYKINNRIVPYILPNKIQKKLVNLINVFNLNTCSIDMIVTKNNEYVLLEINPAGQFGNISKMCNYNLEKQIANELIRKM